MKRINDIFYSLQGEGRNTGRAAVFIRFSGCNLRCPFCDTEFDSGRTMSDDDILAAVAALVPTSEPPSPADASVPPSLRRILIVLTGGEPTLQADEAFVDLLHRHGYEVAMESNGTRPAPRNLDWLTLSPKEETGSENAAVQSEKAAVQSEKDKTGNEERAAMRMPDELKVVFDEHTDPESVLRSYSSLFSSRSALLYLQPCDTGDARRNEAIVEACIRYIKSHPWWRLSLQTHKLVGFK